MTQPTPPHKSAMALAIEERAAARPLESFDLTGYFGPGSKPVGAVLIRANTKSEQDGAVDMAHAYAKEHVRDEDARKDADIIVDMKMAGAVWHACRDVNDPKYPAFPTPAWMCQMMSSDQIGALANLCNGVRVKNAPWPSTVDPDVFDRVVGMCADLGGNGIPMRILAGWKHETLAHAFVLLSMNHKSLEREAVELRAAVAEHKMKPAMGEVAPEEAGEAGEDEGGRLAT